MKPQKVRHLLEMYGKIDRIYLAPEGMSQHMLSDWKHKNYMNKLNCWFFVWQIMQPVVVDSKVEETRKSNTPKDGLNSWTRKLPNELLSR